MIIGIKEKLRKIWRYQFHFWNFFLKIQGRLVSIFVLNFTFYDGFQGNITFEALSFDF